MSKLNIRESSLKRFLDVFTPDKDDVAQHTNIIKLSPPMESEHIRMVMEVLYEDLPSLPVKSGVIKYNGTAVLSFDKHGGSWKVEGVRNDFISVFANHGLKLVNSAIISDPMMQTAAAAMMNFPEYGLPEFSCHKWDYNRGVYHFIDGEGKEHLINHRMFKEQIMAAVEKGYSWYGWTINDAGSYDADVCICLAQMAAYDGEIVWG